MLAIVTYTVDAVVSAFPAAVDLHWKIENRVVWNEHEHANEERELIYEISWIAELGAWRRFLRSQRKVQR
jgi:predicted transposase YbfD/YdcC